MDTYFDTHIAIFNGVIEREIHCWIDASYAVSRPDKYSPGYMELDTLVIKTDKTELDITERIKAKYPSTWDWVVEQAEQQALEEMRLDDDIASGAYDYEDMI